MTTDDRVTLPPLDDLLACRGQRCGECGTVASKDAWDRAWWRERSRRMGAGALYSDEPDRNYGLDEREVCPKCWYVHSDNDVSSVEEVQGTFVHVPDCPSCGQRPGKHKMSCPIGGPI